MVTKDPLVGRDYESWRPLAVIASVICVDFLTALRAPLIAYGLLAPVPGPVFDVPTWCLLPLTGFTVWWVRERPQRVPRIREPSARVRIGFYVSVGLLVACLIPAVIRGALTYSHGQPGFDAACHGAPSVNLHGTVACVSGALYSEYLAGAIGLFNAIPSLILLGFVSTLVVTLLNRRRD